MLDLGNVTLLGVTSRDHVDTLRVLQHCQLQAKFHNTVFISNSHYHTGRFNLVDLVRADCPTFEQMHDICVWWLTSIHKYRHLFAPYILSIHHDGYIIKPSAWSNDFLNYDFIGAPFSDKMVGNNGFCIYTTKLIDAIEALKFQPHQAVCHPSDKVLFQKNFLRLKAMGCKIAPFDVANRFAADDWDYEGQFGFHGLKRLRIMKDQMENLVLPKHHQVK